MQGAISPSRLPSVTKLSVPAQPNPPSKPSKRLVSSRYSTGAITVDFLLTTLIWLLFDTPLGTTTVTKVACVSVISALASPKNTSPASAVTSYKSKLLPHTFTVSPATAHSLSKPVTIKSGIDTARSVSATRSATFTLILFVGSPSGSSRGICSVIRFASRKTSLILSSTPFTLIEVTLSNPSP